MKDTQKTRQQLIDEITALRARVAELERGETSPQAEETGGGPISAPEGEQGGENATTPIHSWLDDWESVSIRLQKEEAGLPPYGEKSKPSGNRIEKAILRLASFPESNPHPIAEIDRDGHITYLNPAARRLFPELMAAAVEGRAVLSRHPWLADWESVVDRLQADQSGVLIREVTIGGSCYQQAMYKGSDYIRIYGIDITWHKQTEDALRASESRYRELVQNANSAIIRWARDGTILFFNEYAQSLFGYSFDEIVGKNVSMLVPEIESTGGDLTRLADDIIAHPERFANNVNENICRDGRRVWMAWTNKPLFDENNQISAILAVGMDITERRQIEEVSRKSEEQLRRSQEIAHLGSWELDLADNQLAWSDEVYRVFGFTPQAFDATYDTFLDRVHPDDRAAVDDAYVSSLRDGRDVYEIEHRIIRQNDGEIRYVHEKCEHVRDASGKVIRSTGMVHDITERKQAEMALRESEERFRRAIQEAPFPIMMHAEDGEVLALSDTWLELTGYAFQDICTVARWTQKAFGDRCALIKAEIDRLYGLTGKVQEGEYTIRTSSGASRLWDVSSTPLGTLSDGRRLVLSIAVDVTERRQAEEALLQANEQLALAQESAGAGVWDWDMRTDQLDWSPELFRLFGLDTNASPTFDLWRRVIHPDDRQMAQDHIDEAIRDHKPLCSEYRIGEPGGEVRWINALGNTTYDAHGKARRMSGICIEVTERKQMEEALYCINLDLQASNKELDAFGHTVAHDLKNPLGSIIGFANLLTDEENPLPMETIRDLARNFEELSLRMDNVIEELMLLAGLRKGIVKMRPLDMAQAVAEAQRRLTYLIRNSHAEIVGPSSWPQAMGYDSWAEEVWINYISNAIKYGGQPPTIELGAAQQGDLVRFWVRDNGAGVTDEQKSRLFQPFERLDQANLKGHGLGLSIVRRIVERMDGQVYVESSGIPGEGSTFGFELPHPHSEGQPGSL